MLNVRRKIVESQKHKRHTRDSNSHFQVGTLIIMMTTLKQNIPFPIMGPVEYGAGPDRCSDL